MNDVMLRMKDVSFSYDAEPVLRHVSMEIRQGEFIGVLGPNGSGKSTLLKLMGGILKNDQGEIFFRETLLKSYRQKQLAQSIAWIPQEHSMVFPFRVSEIVMMGRHPYLSPLTFEGKQDIDIVAHAMKTTETVHLSGRRFNEISGGEKQRVLMAGALAQEPEMMLLDEPTAALDIKYQVEILGILKRLNEQNNMTLVMAMHDLHLASKFCRRLILLNQGRVVRDGGPDQVLQKEVLESVYGVPVRLFRDEKDGSVMISPEL